MDDLRFRKIFNLGITKDMFGKKLSKLEKLQSLVAKCALMHPTLLLYSVQCQIIIFVKGRVVQLSGLINVYKFSLDPSQLLLNRMRYQQNLNIYPKLKHGSTLSLSLSLSIYIYIYMNLWLELDNWTL